MTGPDAAFWQQRFETQQMGWDRGGPSPQLLAYLDSGALQPCRIAVPGCGAGWEVAELAARGFDVLALDYTPAAVERTRALLQARGLRATVEQADVLIYTPSAPLDAVYEQTCWCALHPDHWARYAAQLHAWLRPGGVLWAQWMQRPRPAAVEEGLIEGPPYHTDINAVRALLPSNVWDWPAPPYAQVAHPTIGHELAMHLVRK